MDDAKVRHEPTGIPISLDSFVDLIVATCTKRPVPIETKFFDKIMDVEPIEYRKEVLNKDEIQFSKNKVACIFKRYSSNS